MILLALYPVTHQYMVMPASLRAAESIREWEKRETYTLMLEALYDCKCPLVLMILHHEPRHCLLVLAVHIASFDELVVQFGDGLGGILGVEVDYDSIDHF